MNMARIRTGVSANKWLKSNHFHSFALLTACLLQCVVANKVNSRGFPKFGRSFISSEDAYQAATLSNSANAISRSVRLPLGNVRGMPCPFNESVTQYLGIPFADSVLGPARFTPPRAFSTAYPYPYLNASKRPPACGCICNPEGEFTENSAEDCLFLNIWVPPGASATSQEKRPVRVFIHGGNIMSCSASDPQWNGCNAAAKTGMIHVNIQYRMGPFGMLAHPLLMKEFNTTGNWAILDQQLAMRWVKEHIAFFGGDPSKILLNGHSRGGQLVDYHMVAPGSAGLFSAAIAMSPSCAVLRTLEQAYNDSHRYMVFAGCAPLESPEAELECMRTKPYLHLRKAAVALEDDFLPDALWCDHQSWQPSLAHTVDGTTLPQTLTVALEAGNAHKVPYMSGITTAEAGAMVERNYPSGVTHTDILSFIQKLYPGADPEPILALYPLEHFEGAPNVMDAMFVSLWTDAMWSCPFHERLTARRKGLRGASVPTYVYYWGTNPSCPPDLMYLGPFHGADLWFTFGNTDGIHCAACPTGTCSLNKPEKELSDMILATFTSMVETGVPTWRNGTSWAEWDEVDEMGTYLNAGLALTLPIGFKQKCTALLDAKQLPTR